VRRPSIAVLVVAASLSSAALASPARAARSVPQGFVGSTVDGPLATDDTSLFSSQLQPMVQAGVESLRMTFSWSLIQPYRTIDDVPEASRDRYRIVDGVPTDFTLTDQWVAEAARRGLRIMPVLMYPPGWASRRLGLPGSPPRDYAEFARFAVTLVRRYGSAGSFWRERTDVPRVAIVRWQVWNEPHLRAFWNDRPWEADYVNLLRRAYPAIRGADPEARVVLGSLTNKSWDILWEIYGQGGKGYFDYVALHPFTARVPGIVTIIENARRVMKLHGDSGRHILLTEMSWPSAKGRTTRRYTFDVTEQGQAVKIAAAYGLLAREHTRLKLDGVFWYTWLTTDSARVDSFGYAGVTKLVNGAVVRKPAYRSLRETALPLEGCRSKPVNAGVCG
jgi:polysaccharide biosynthesis protein PslG